MLSRNDWNVSVFVFYPNFRNKGTRPFRLFTSSPVRALGLVENIQLRGCWQLSHHRIPRDRRALLPDLPGQSKLNPRKPSGGQVWAQTLALHTLQAGAARPKRSLRSNSFVHSKFQIVYPVTGLGKSAVCLVERPWNTVAQRLTQNFSQVYFVEESRMRPFREWILDTDSV